MLLIAIAMALQLSWIILNWRKELMLFVGVVLFAVVIAGLVLNTIFLVREVRRNEQQDSFLNAVTHELKTPIASLRLYLETLQNRRVGPAQAQQFYRVMLADTERLLGTVEQVLRAGELGHKRLVQAALEVDLRDILLQSMELVRTRHHLNECICASLPPRMNRSRCSGTRRSFAPLSPTYSTMPSSIPVPTRSPSK